MNRLRGCVFAAVVSIAGLCASNAELFAAETFGIKGLHRTATGRDLTKSSYVRIEVEPGEFDNDEEESWRTLLGSVLGQSELLIVVAQVEVTSGATKEVYPEQIINVMENKGGWFQGLFGGGTKFNWTGSGIILPYIALDDKATISIRITYFQGKKLGEKGNYKANYDPVRSKIEDTIGNIEKGQAINAAVSAAGLVIEGIIQGGKREVNSSGVYPVAINDLLKNRYYALVMPHKNSPARFDGETGEAVSLYNWKKIPKKDRDIGYVGIKVEVDDYLIVPVETSRIGSSGKASEIKNKLETAVAELGRQIIALVSDPNRAILIRSEILGRCASLRRTASESGLLEHDIDLVAANFLLHEQVRGLAHGATVGSGAERCLNFPAIDALASAFKGNPRIQELANLSRPATKEDRLRAFLSAWRANNIELMGELLGSTEKKIAVKVAESLPKPALMPAQIVVKDLPGTIELSGTLTFSGLKQAGEYEARACIPGAAGGPPNLPVKIVVWGTVSTISRIEIESVQGQCT